MDGQMPWGNLHSQLGVEIMKYFSNLAVLASLHKLFLEFGYRVKQGWNHSTDPIA